MITRMKNESVPQTKQTEFNFNAVRVEPVLQIQVAIMPPHKRRVMASVYRRWAHQLEKTADVLEAQAAPRPPRRSLRRLSTQQLHRN
jgi:hypothetical protein